MFNVGDQVHFGRSSGETTLGTVLKVNAKSLKIRQDESRGTMKTYPIGTIWTVGHNLATLVNGATPTLASVTAPTTKGQWTIGQRVEFTHPKRLTVINGTISRINTKSITLVNTSDGHPVGWRVGPHMLRPSTSTATPPTVTVAPVPPGFRIGAPVSYEGFSWKTKAGPAKATVTGVITLIDPTRGTVEIFSAEDTRKTKRLPFSNVTLCPTKRTDDDILDSICTAYSGLEPETLTCDGERPRAEQYRITAELNRALRALQTELGRTVSSSEAFARDLRQDGRHDLADRLAP